MIYTDQLGRRIELPQTPKRIISLVPSLTELLFDLGVGDNVVGVTKFCIHPKTKTKEVTKIGGTKNFKFDVIQNLEPDLIIGNKEENYKEGIEQLSEKLPVWVSDIETLKEAYQTILEIGKLVGEEAQAQYLVSEIQSNLSEIQPIKKRVLYLIWQNPYISVGKHTFIDEMLQICGFENVLKMARYPELSVSEIQKLSPDLILLSSEPYPFQEKHLNYFECQFPESQVILVDGELFSWYGSRLKLSGKYLQNLINSNQ